MTSRSPVPEHVPSERVVDADIYALDGAEDDFLEAWVRLRDTQRHDIVWSPRNGGHWIAMRGEHIDAMYRDARTYSSHAVLVPRRVAEAYRLKPTNLDPPEHRGYRQVLSRALSPQATDEAEPVVRAVAQELIETLRLRGRCDLVRALAERLPLIVFFRLAELPLPDPQALPRYAEPIRVRDDGVSDAHVMDRFAEHLRPYCRARRQRPGTDLLSRIVCSEVNGAPMSENDAVELATTVLTGGIDTVCSTLCLIMAFLADSPVHQRALREESGVLERALPELLRRFPIMTKGRLVTRDHTVDGVTLRAGDMIVLPPLHGLDERLFGDPARVDLDRPQRPSLTFGSGPHRCPGASLATLEIRTALEVWLRHIPHFTRCPKRPPRMQGGVLGAVLELELRWNTTSGR